MYDLFYHRALSVAHYVHAQMTKRYLLPRLVECTTHRPTHISSDTVPALHNDTKPPTVRTPSGALWGNEYRYGCFLESDPTGASHSESTSFGLRKILSVGALTYPTSSTKKWLINVPLVTVLISSGIPVCPRNAVTSIENGTYPSVEFVA